MTKIKKVRKDSFCGLQLVSNLWLFSLGLPSTGITGVHQGDQLRKHWFGVTVSDLLLCANSLNYFLTGDEGSMSWQNGTREQNRSYHGRQVAEREGGQGLGILFNCMTTQWLTSSSKALSPNRPFCYELINGFVHWWSQFPHDPVTSHLLPAGESRPSTPKLFQGLLHI